MHLLVVVDNAGDLLGVSPQSGHHLLRGLLKHHSCLVCPSSEGSRSVSRDIQTQNPWHTGTVETLVWVSECECVGSVGRVGRVVRG